LKPLEDDGYRKRIYLTYQELQEGAQHLEMKIHPLEA
jgi:hypothetical protein